ncbi:MAG: leucine-rich repeat protein, partial [Clostridia bacterium]|nr:leucine-rich repeat protein [Clostridia bacterium]
MNVWMKKITACVMAAAMLLMAVPTIAVPTMVTSAEETAGDFTYQVNGSLGRAIITGYTGNATEVVVPAELGGYPVTSISDDVFENNTQIVRVVLPDGVTSFDSLFYGCTSLQSVELPDSLQSIGSYAFYNCTKLSDIELPNTLRFIENMAFYNCAALTSLVIPEGVTNIGDRAFASCEGLQSVSLPKSLTWIYSTAFSGCSAITELHIADLTAWCRVGFIGNTIPFSTPHDLYIAGERVEDLVIPEGITRINDYAFAYANIRSLTAPDSVIAIGGGAFYGCELLTDIDLPDTILEIKSCSAFLETGYYNDPNNWTDQALYLDGYLLQIQSGISGDYTVREATTLIAGYAFSSGGKITGISLPDSVVAVGEYAFDGTAYYRNSENWTNDCLYIDHCLIQVKKTYTGSYTPPAGITVVADGAFRECTGLSGVTLPAKAQVIGHNTFGGCTSLSSIHIPAGVRYVHETAFANCSSLNTITLSAENPVFSIIGECLVYTPTRTLVVGTNRGSIPDDGRVTAIGSYAFSGRLGLQTLFIPTCVESVGYQALYGCTGLKDVYIGTAGVPAPWNVEWKEWWGTVHTGYTTDSR